MNRARVAFLGSPDFAVEMLRVLVDADIDIVGVVTQPDRPAGRGKQLRAPPVKVFAQQHGLEVWQPDKIRGGRLRRWLQEREVDLAVVAAFGRILTAPMLRAPRLGCVNLHASLLPRWRGASPIHRAVAAGDAESGVCLMQMDVGLDTGPVLARAAVAIAPDDTAASLHDKLARAGAMLLSDRLSDLLGGRLSAVAQPDEGVTYAPLLTKDEGKVDWSQPAAHVHNQVRGFSPWPGTWTAGPDGQRWKVHADGAAPVGGSGAPGEVIALDASGVSIACGTGALCVTDLQRPGKKRGRAADVLRGARLGLGTVFGDKQ